MSEEVKEKSATKYCKYCEREITTTNFSEHKKTKKHVKNMKDYKEPNLLETNEDTSNMKYIKLELEELKNNIEKIIKNVNP